MPLRAARPRRSGFGLAAAVCVSVGPAPLGARDPLRGEYGFLTDFGSVSAEDARARVRYMWDFFRILEFQFYDAFHGYSYPPPQAESWGSPFGRPVKRDILMAYTDEIARLGGRSWLYVQAAAIDPGDGKTQTRTGVKVIGQHIVDGRPLLDVIAPNAAWARWIAADWASFAAAYNFSGIHWDTLGNKFGIETAGGDIAGFLRAAQPILRRHGLAQTCNFVDGFGWETSLHGGVGWAGNTVAFPYLEAWTLPEAEDTFFNKVAPHGGGVFVHYPGYSEKHTAEVWNPNAFGIWPLDLLILRWQKARCHGSSYLAIGDGARHLQDEYFPNAVPISESDAVKIRNLVFQTCAFFTTCHAPSPEPGLPSSAYGAAALVGMILFCLGRCSAKSMGVAPL